jgi:hypothetical protein
MDVFVTIDTELFFNRFELINHLLPGSVAVLAGSAHVFPGQGESGLGMVKLRTPFGRNIPALIGMTLGTPLSELFFAKGSFVWTGVTNFAGLLRKILEKVYPGWRTRLGLRKFMTTLALHSNMLALDRISGVDIMIKLPLRFPVMAVIRMTHGTLIQIPHLLRLARSKTMHIFVTA